MRKIHYQYCAACRKTLMLVRRDDDSVGYCLDPEGTHRIVNGVLVPHHRWCPTLRLES